MIKNVPISLSGLMNIKLGQATLGSYNNLNRRHWPAIFLHNKYMILINY